MPVYKDEQRGTWYISYRYWDWQGKRKRFIKRGFKTKKEASEFERKHRVQESNDLDMTFGDFVEIYLRDTKDRVRGNTYETKINILETKILPTFKDKKMNEIQPRDIVRWQSSMMQMKTKKGEPYSQVYLKTIHNQITVVFNHAVRLYELKANPVHKAGSMGKKKGSEKKFWTQEEYFKFADCAMDDPNVYYACEILYWGGLRVSELLGLTQEDFDFKRKSMRIARGYHKLIDDKEDTRLKNANAYRYVTLPDFLLDEMQDYFRMHYHLEPNERLFTMGPDSLRKKIGKYAKKAGVKRITIHEFRHSHISLLIEHGFTALAIGDRVGHGSEEITNGYAHLFPSKQSEMAIKLSEIRGENES